MTDGLSADPASDAPIRGRVDADGRLVEADSELFGLHLRAGGEEGVRSLSRKSRRSRGSRRASGSSSPAP